MNGLNSSKAMHLAFTSIVMHDCSLFRSYILIFTHAIIEYTFFINKILSYTTKSIDRTHEYYRITSGK